MSGFMSSNPLEDPTKRGPVANNTVQMGPSGKPGPLSELTTKAALPVATAAMGSLPTAAIPATLASTTAAGVAIPATAAVAGTAGQGLLGAAGSMLGMGGATAAGAGAAGMAAMAPMLAAAGPFALMALPFLLNNGTKKVPGYNEGSKNVDKYTINRDYGSDPFAPSGTSYVESQPAASALGGLFNYVPDAYQMSNYLTSLFAPQPTPAPVIPAPLSAASMLANTMGAPAQLSAAGMLANTMGKPVAQPGTAQQPMVPQYQPIEYVGGQPATQPGRAPQPGSAPLSMATPTVVTDNMMNTGNYEQQLANYRAAGYNYGTKKVSGYNNGTNMAYAGGEDSVPAMLTPGEAIIPAAAAQNPNNQPMIDSMIQEGRSANAMAEGQAPQAPMAPPPTPPMAGPLSGSSQRAQVESLQGMAMKKKAFEAEEARKQQSFEQKLALDKQKALMSMQT